jgi:peptide-methionine (R)-S-oxide reductase
MIRQGLRLGTCVSTAMLVGLAVSIAAAAQDPFQAAAKSGSESAAQTDEKSAAKKSEPEFVIKTDEEWRRILNPAVYLVTRRKETEPAFTGKYASGHFRGTFVCVCCGSELFNSQHKFESGTGWPSFWRPVSDKSLARAIDNSDPAEQRIEVMCRRCGAHLGHVFGDGPPPTGLRFCINSLALKLKPPEGASSAKPASTKTKTKSKTKPTAKGKARNVPPSTGSQGTAAPAPDSPGQNHEKPSGSKPPPTGN